jgi:hypothetical protein
MIGWYIHHVGLGHLHRAVAVCRELRTPVTGLSSLPRPRTWRGDWVELAPDDETAGDVTAGGQLHWAPLHDAGLRQRMATLSSWIAQRSPRVVVADVSVEVALLARLHGVPVVSVVLPGERSDAAHLMGYRVSTSLVAAWPRSARTVVTGLPRDLEQRIHYVGGLSRLEVAAATTRRAGTRRVAVLAGAGGTTTSQALLAAARREAREWRWQVLAPPPLGSWMDDPTPVLRESDVVVTHAGQNAVAEVAGARRPAIVVPERRPYAEQEATARELARRRWPAVLLESWPRSGWRSLLEEAATLDGRDWADWCDGDAARRFARIIEETAGRDAHRAAAG